MSFLENLPFYDVILDFVNETLNLDGYIADAFNFFNSLDVVTQLLVIVVGGIIFVMGVFELIKKLSKIIIVVGIIVGLYLLYDSGALDGLIGG
jgi:predicted permease